MSLHVAWCMQGEDVHALNISQRVPEKAGVHAHWNVVFTRTDTTSMRGGSSEVEMCIEVLK